MKISYNMKRGAVAAFLVGCLLLAGVLEKQQLDEDQARYCRMVHAGAWPDFKESYDAECIAGVPRP